ncbi:ATP synthase F0 subunit B [bacterium]|nr:ATP synthase F0 subunit B [bacterium]
MRILILVFVFLFLVGGSLWAAEEAAHGAEGEHHETIWQTIGKWVNFAALVSILYLFLNKSIRVQDKFKAEADEIRRSIESAREAKEEAERQLQAMDQRMQLMSQEVTRIKTQALQDAEEEKKRILDSAQKEAQRIVEMAHREVDNEVRLARKVLRRHAADLSVQQGQKIIEQEINDEDQRRLVKTYIEEFGK